MHAVAVSLTGLDGRQIGVPDVGVDLAELDPRLGARLVEETQLDLGGGFAEDREIGAAAVVGRAEWVGIAGPGVHRTSDWDALSLEANGPAVRRGCPGTVATMSNTAVLRVHPHRASSSPVAPEVLS
nr:hypothetical protein GCM10025699_59260 [Microbacterium flavescens]